MHTAGREPPKLKKQEKHTIEVVVDRLAVKPSAKRRLTDSVETALRLGGGLVVLDFVDLPEDDPDRERTFSEHLACLYDDLSFEELEPRSFSFNSPFGACPECHGLGTRMEVDPELVVPDPSPVDRRRRDHAVVRRRTSPTTSAGCSARSATTSASRSTCRSRDLPAEAQRALLHGHEQQVHVRYKQPVRPRAVLLDHVRGRHPVRRAAARRGRDRHQPRAVRGLHARGAVPGLRRRPAQAGRRWPSRAGADGDERNIAEVCALPIERGARSSSADLDLTARERQIAERVLKEINERLRFLLDVGLDYLTLDRPSGTLAGGEAQRIRLATQIGSGLVGVLYVLDEPSIGLHQRDNHRLIETLLRLRDLGNTLIVVEHDEDTIRSRRLGGRHRPGRRRARRPGRRVRHRSRTCSTHRRLAHRRVPVRARGRSRCPTCAGRATPGRELVVKGAREHNLQDIDVAFPLGCSSRSPACPARASRRWSTTSSTPRWPSGSTAPARSRAGTARSPAPSTSTRSSTSTSRRSAAPRGPTRRPTPACSTTSASCSPQTTEAKVRGYQPGRFSFNVKGGRCEACSGDGTIKIEMNFLPDVYVPCEVCHGARYNRETLEVHYKGKIDRRGPRHADRGGGRLLRARSRRSPGTCARWSTSASATSGSASRRRRCPAARRSGSSWPPSCRSGRPGAPSTCSTSRPPGCTSRTSASCSGVLQSLVDKGNTVIVIEHNLDVIKTADWVVDMGPEGGTGGGSVVAEGTPEQVAADAEQPHRRVPAAAAPTSRRAARSRRRPANEEGPSRDRRQAGRARPSVRTAGAKAS